MADQARLFPVPTVVQDSYSESLLADYGADDACVTHLLCSRHPADRVALTVVDGDRNGVDWTFGELLVASGRVAASFAELGVGPGDRVATMMDNSAELIVTLLAVWRLGAVHVPLFTAFAPPSVALRVNASGTRLIVVDAEYRHKVGPGLPERDRPLVVSTGEPRGSDLALAELATAAGPAPDAVAMGGDAAVIELFTSGTTGTPKAVPIPVRCIAGMHAYQDYGLYHTDDDVYWNAANVGWAYGLYYAIVAPLAAGRRTLVTRGRFSARFTWSVLAEFGVTNFAAAPTVYRALRNAQEPVPGGLRVRRCSSAGEPLTPEVLEWSRRVFGVDIHDHFGQTEIGMLLGNPWHPELAATRRIGTMGRALPGFRAEVLQPDADVPAAPGQPGRLAVDCWHSPLMTFAGYRGAPRRTAERFSANRRWYYTGDLAVRDADGCFTFESRDDDVILMAGYRIGPFEVERVLAAHPAVTEVAVAGEPDELLGQVIAAHVVVRPGVAPDERLSTQLRQLVKTELAAHAYPRKVYYVDELPRTPSGKIQRFLLAGRAA